jgi:hypothetical protein
MRMIGRIATGKVFSELITLQKRTHLCGDVG